MSHIALGDDGTAFDIEAAPTEKSGDDADDGPRHVTTRLGVGDKIADISDRVLVKSGGAKFEGVVISKQYE